jgi:hypothetical protein
MLQRVTHRRAPRALLAGALALAIGLAVTACQPPITPDNRPTTVPGQVNGQLSTSMLATVGTGCTVYSRVAASMTQMIAAAQKDGVVLRGNSCYRDYAGQVSAREFWCGQGSCAMAAVPGTSNHGWGKAVDFATSTGSLTFDSLAYAWMAHYAWIFGWNHPGWAEQGQPTAEPWHWEWVGDGGVLYPGTTVGP